MDELRLNIVAKKTQGTPDVHSTLELMYLRVLGRVKNKAPLENDLKALKKTLDLAASQITAILKKSGGSSSSK